jgi:hypothetical protein
MCQGDVMAPTEVNHGFGLQFLGIFCYKLSRAAESRKYIGFQKVHNHFVSSIPGGHDLDPFGKVVSGSEDPLMLPNGGWVYITYEI